MKNAQTDHEQQLCSLVKSSPQLMVSLRAVRSLGLSSWCIGAGVIRSLVWDSLHRFQKPSAVDDVDVAYFDAEAPLQRDADLQRQLQFRLPMVNWDVTNQARVHECQADTPDQAISPLTSLEEGLATWPEFATCVGVCLDGKDSLTVVAPYGLDDLFELRVRHNPRRASVSTFVCRVQSKRFSERWPDLAIVIP